MTCSNKHSGYDSYNKNHMNGYHGVNRMNRGYNKIGAGINVAGIGASVGIDRNGYNKGYGYNKDGWDHKGYHEYDMKGYNKDGWDHKGYHDYDMKGYNKDGWDHKGYHDYDMKGYHRNGYNKDGWDHKGYHEYMEGYNNGYDNVGLGVNVAGIGAGVGINRNGYNKDGYTDVRHRSPVRQISHRSPVRHTLVSHNPVRHSSPIRHRSPARYENLDGRKSIERRMLEAELASSRLRDKNGRFL
jgi:hypothetical protein